MRTRSRLLPRLVLLAACFAAPTSLAQSWVPGPPMPTPRSDAAVAVLDGSDGPELYVMGGRNVAGTALDRVERFDSDEDTWETVPSLRDERSAAAAAVYNGRIVLTGGYDDHGEVSDDVEVYVDGDWESFDDLEQDRAGHAAVVLDGAIFVLGGVGVGGSPLASSEGNDGDDWYPYTSWMLDPGRAYFGAVEANGAAYLAGGLSQFGPLDTFERYVAEQETVPLASLPAPRGNLALVSTGDALFAIGGVDPSGTVLATVTRYDIAQNTWTPVASLGTARAGAVAAVLGNTIYVVGGRDANGNVLATMERYLLPVDDEDDAAPRAFGLDAAYPNPFAQQTTLAFRLDRPGPVALTVYDVRGREVAVLVDGVLPAGEHRVAWDAAATGRRLPAGVYVARLAGPSGIAVTKLTLVR